MHKTNAIGNIFVPFGSLPHEHELDVAKILIRTGNDVRFLATSTQPTPDILYCKLKWEIKSPTGKSSRTIENNLRKAIQQSPNVILDLQRIHIPDKKCLLYLKNHLSTFRGMKRLLIVTKDQEILNFDIKTACITPVPMLK